MKSERMRFRKITLGGACIASLLWVLAGHIATKTGDMYSYVILGIMAGTASMIAINSARKEGMLENEHTREDQEPEE